MQRNISYIFEYLNIFPEKMQQSVFPEKMQPNIFPDKKGTNTHTKMDVFSEKFRMELLTPSPSHHIREIILRIFFQYCS